MSNFNLIYTRHNLNGMAPKINAKPITYHDLTVVIKGRLEYMIDGKEIVLEGGDLIFIPQGSVRYRNASDTSVDYISFNFTCDREIHLPEYLHGAVHSDALLLIAAFDKINSVPYLDNGEKNGYLLACLISVFEDRIKRQSFNPLTLKIMGYLRTNLGSKITLGDISKITFFSPIYCDTVFKKDTGRSIIDYLLDMRIDEAKTLLREGTLSLQQISESVGFNDYNYFSRVFKSRSGYSPTAYKKMMFENNG